MARHRGKFDPTKSEPYELSRGSIEKFKQCPACFWMEKAKGIKFPGFPQFNLNTNTDTLLKRDFDKYRGKGPHPFMEQNGLSHLRPYDHPDIFFWERSLHFGMNDQHFSVVHEGTNIRFGGGLDDVWEDMSTGVLYIVDYKSTANLSAEPTPVSLDGPWKGGYKRQMDMYQWILRAKGYEVSDIGYFVYVDGQHKDIEGMINDDTSKATMIFNTSLLEYEGDDSWVEQALIDAKACILETECPSHAQTGYGPKGDKPCEYSALFEAMKDNGVVI